MILEEFDKWLVDRVNALSRKNYVAQINKFLKTSDFLESKNESHIRLFLAQGMQHRIYARKYAMKKFLEFCTEKKYISFNYTDILKETRYKVKKRRGINTLEYEKCVQVIENTTDQELRLLVMLAFDTGARIRALITLRIDDIYIYPDKVELRLSEKGDHPQTKYLTPQTYKHLSDWVKQKNNPMYVFFSTQKLTLDDINDKYYTLWSRLKNESRRILGVDRAPSWHWIRRGAGYYWFKKTKKNIKAVQKFYDHTSDGQTSTYLDIAGEEISELMKKEKRKW